MPQQVADKLDVLDVPGLIQPEGGPEPRRLLGEGALAEHDQDRIARRELPDDEQRETDAAE
jgi:hypothetical protein